MKSTAPTLRRLPGTPQPEDVGVFKTVERIADLDEGPGVLLAPCELLIKPLPVPPSWVVVGCGCADATAGADLFVAPSSGKEVWRAVLAAAKKLAVARSAQLESDRIASAYKRLSQQLIELSAALTEEKDLDSLLARTLTAARKLVGADAGSLYLLESEGVETRLRFKVAQNDSLASFPWREKTLPLDRRSIASVAALSSKPVVVDDAYALEGKEGFSFNREIDEATGYRTRSMLAVPLVTRSGEVIGVIQLINRKRNRAARLLSPEDVAREVIPFDEENVALAKALASQAALVIEASRLRAELEQLFDSFVAAVAIAIEQRDPPTFGHSRRVAELSLALAREAGLELDEDQEKALRYAALLHDVGKLGVRESVLTKEGRLHPHQKELILERMFAAMKSDQLGKLLDEARCRHLKEKLEAAEKRFKELMEAVSAACDPRVDPSPYVAKLAQSLSVRVEGWDGAKRPLLSPQELAMLSSYPGNLSPSERKEMESHVEHTKRFLEAIPWPRKLSSVPQIASLHHERLDGSGYPLGLKADRIPMEARVLQICDVFDALVASDRPYKPALSARQACQVLLEEAEAGKLDPHLARVMAEKKPWLKVEAYGLL